MAFDDLSRGDQYLVLLSREYEAITREADLDVRIITDALNKYSYSTGERMELEESLRLRKNDLEFYQRSLVQLKGAANEEPILTVPSTESLSQFTGETCTTVL